MSLWSWLRGRLAGDGPATRWDEGKRADIESARTRATGGAPRPGAPDAHSTTGTTPSETFVGRASGDDPGDVEASGAEVRAEHEEQRRSREHRTDRGD